MRRAHRKVGGGEVVKREKRQKEGEEGQRRGEEGTYLELEAASCEAGDPLP